MAGMMMSSLLPANEVPSAWAQDSPAGKRGAARGRGGTTLGEQLHFQLGFRLDFLLYFHYTALRRVGKFSMQRGAGSHLLS